MKNTKKRKTAASRESGSPSLSKIDVWATQFIPMLGVVLAFSLAFKYGIGWMEIITFLCMVTLGSVGIEIGFHRYFAHKAFKAVNPLPIVFVILGSMARNGMN